MKVSYKQNNSRMCVMCGLDNPFGVQAPFYVMEDQSVMTLFRFREEHQSYPGPGARRPHHRHAGRAGIPRLLGD